MTMNEERDPMHSSETSSTGAGTGRRSMRRLLPAVLLLMAMLACIWLSASALGRTYTPRAAV
jgi:hypothetical protein